MRSGSVPACVSSMTPTLGKSSAALGVARLQLTAERIERWRGLKKGTRGQYVDAALRYESVCEYNGQPAWPISIASLEAFAVCLGGNLLPSSVDTNVSRLRLYCAAMGLSYPPSPALHGLRLIMRGQRRRAWRSTKRATPLRCKHLLHFMRHLNDASNAAHLQLAAMLWLGHGALLRSKELLNLRREDVLVTKFGVRVHVRPHLSKTSLGGEGDTIWVPRKGSHAYPLLCRWLRLSDPGPGALLWGRYSYTRWLAQVKEVGKELGLPGVTTHSLRAGGCTDLLQGGASHELVKRQGRWRSDCFLQYWRPEPAELAAHLGAAYSAASRKLLTVEDPVLAAAGSAGREQRSRVRRQRQQAMFAHRVRWQQ